MHCQVRVTDALTHFHLSLDLLDPHPEGTEDQLAPKLPEGYWQQKLPLPLWATEKAMVLGMGTEALIPVLTSRSLGLNLLDCKWEKQRPSNIRSL